MSDKSPRFQTINSGHFVMDHVGNRRAVVPNWGAAKLDNRFTFTVRKAIINEKAIAKAWVFGP